MFDTETKDIQSRIHIPIMGRAAVAACSVVSFPAKNLNDIPSLMEGYAERLRSGEEAALKTTVVVTIDMEGALDLRVWGDSDSNLRLVGILEAAKVKVLRSIWEEGS